MMYFKRIFLFILTNLLIMVTVGIAFTVLGSIFGIPPGAEGGLVGLLLFAGIFGFAGAFISLFMSKSMARWMMGVKIVDSNTTDPRLRDVVTMVKDAARRAHLPKSPEVGVYDSPEINAFATGPSRSNSLVAVSTGLLQRLDRNELEGVLGHEVAHIANGDMVTMTLIQGVVNTFVIFFSRVIANIVSNSIDERFRFIAYFGLSILFDILFGILGSVVVAFYSRQREFRADAGSARLVGKEKMIAALRALEQNTVGAKPRENEAAFASLKIDHRRGGGGLLALMSTHPPLKMRIRALEKMR